MRLMRRPVASAALVVLGIVAQPQLQAEDRDARQWLQRMGESLSTRNYEGRFFHVRDERSESMRIIHRVDGKGRVTERLVSLDGSGREIIRNQDEVICYLPDRRTVLVEKRIGKESLLAVVPSYNSQLTEHYEIRRGPFTKALGRRSQVILVQPRDQFRYGYKLWLDAETAMPLKSQLLDRSGNVIEQILFAEINFRERIPVDSLRPAVSGEGFRWVRQDEFMPRMLAEAGSAGWNVIRVPAGFRLTTARTQAIAGARSPVQHLVYSDGLASVSVFIEPTDPDAEPMRGLSKVGGAFAFTRSLDGHQVIAVGEVPPVTVEAIATSVTKQMATSTRKPRAP